MIKRKLPFLIVLMVFPLLVVSQKKTGNVNPYFTENHQLTLETAYTLTELARAKAKSMGKQVSVAVLDQSGVIVLMSRGDGVGPHNTEAARKKAFTALSTKTATLALARSSKTNPDSENLALLPELLLLGGGVPLWYNDKIIGSIGVAGGGGAENDDLIAKSAQLPEARIKTIKD